MGCRFFTARGRGKEGEERKVWKGGEEGEEGEKGGKPGKPMRNLGGIAVFFRPLARAQPLRSWTVVSLFPRLLALALPLRNLTVISVSSHPLALVSPLRALPPSCEKLRVTKRACTLYVHVNKEITHEYQPALVNWYNRAGVETDICV